jgi:uncharacterized protein YgbK (DUF1537 family)
VTSEIIVVLDDDPTGSQAVSDLPVLTAWDLDDFAWAFGTGHAAVYVLTNSRSLSEADAARVTREAVTNALAAAPAPLRFVSRSDSTLRGHFPLETDVIVEVLRERTGVAVDAVVLVPAFPAAGRVTVGGVHYLVGSDGARTPAGETEFARDATFGYRSSSLADWVAEKTGGRIPADRVIRLDLDLIRSGTPAIVAALADARGGAVAAADILTEADLDLLAAGAIAAERGGQTLVYRSGPSFVRARIGQSPRPPLAATDLPEPVPGAARGGLVVVGSHVGLTTRQLERLRADNPGATGVEIDVALVLDPRLRDRHLDEVIEAAAVGLDAGMVVVNTSRALARTDDPVESLAIARTVSDAVVAVVRGILARRRPAWVVAKGGITSSDVATRGLEIRHAIVRGTLLPGIVSLWEPVSGPAAGIPYVVFPGNVGGDDSLARVVERLTPHS